MKPGKATGSDDVVVELNLEVKTLELSEWLTAFSAASDRKHVDIISILHRRTPALRNIIVTLRRRRGRFYELCSHRGRS